MGKTDSGAKELVKYYVKPDELFCVALKVCVRAITSLVNWGLSFWKYEVCPSLDINLNLFATNFPYNTTFTLNVKLSYKWCKLLLNSIIAYQSGII